jgi:hypothetical protein
VRSREAAGRLVLRARYAVLIALVATGSTPPATAGNVGTGGVRPLQARGNGLVARGLARSATFRWLIDEIAQSDLVVYVDLDPYNVRKQDGVLTFVACAGGMRFVEVWLRPTRTDDELVVTLGHELQHAVEVARAPQIVDQASFAAFYRSAGRSDNPGRFETAAALEVAARVRAELAGHPGPAPASRAPR